MFVKLKAYLILAGGLIAALFAVFLKGKQAGFDKTNAEKLAQEKARREMLAEGKAIDETVRGMSETERIKELKKWAK